MLEPRESVRLANRGAIDLPLLAVFAAVARLSSFTAAARELNTTKGVVSAQLRALEAKCGVRLVDRTTRSVRLTAVGAAALHATQLMLEQARAVDQIVTERRSAPSGRLRVAVPHGLAASVIAPVVAGLVREHPRLSVEIAVDDAVQDLVEGRFDLAVRVGSPKDSVYVLRRLGVSSVILVASPLLALPVVGRPSELVDSPWVRHTVVDRGARFAFSGPHGQRENVRARVQASANTMDAFRMLIVSGAGAGAIPELHVADELRHGTLVQLCPGWVKRSLAVYCLLPSREPSLATELFLGALGVALLRVGLVTRR